MYTLGHSSKFTHYASHLVRNDYELALLCVIESKISVNIEHCLSICSLRTTGGPRRFARWSVVVSEEKTLQKLYHTLNE
jgi:hypothetical protein